MSGGDWKEMYAGAQKGDLELVKYHILNGIDPNYQHPEILSTPLVAAIIEGNIDIAIFLIENGADITLVSDFDMMTPMQAAKMYKRTEIIKILEKMLPPEKSFLNKLIDRFRK